jgi:hypothetical protein
MRTKVSRARRLQVAILNDSPQVLELLCDWFRQHGHISSIRFLVLPVDPALAVDADPQLLTSSVMN